MLESSQIWWKEIAGPRRFVADITDQLLEASLIVRVPDDLPWRHEMRREIESNLREQLDYSEISVLQLDAEEDLPADADVGVWLLNHYAMGDVARQYRKKSGKTIPQYIVETQIFKDDVLWVKGFRAEKTEKWLAFFLAFDACRPRRGRIVLELRDDIVCTLPGSVKVIEYSRYVSNYNLQLFCNFLLDHRTGWTKNWKRYYAALAACLCVTDPEIAELFLSAFPKPDVDPMTIMTKIAADVEYARRGSGADSSHILALMRNRNVNLIGKRIWKAQLQILFPLLEETRVQLIERIKDEVVDLLKKREILQFGERIDNPYDLEWGTLYYAMNLKNVDNAYYLKSLTVDDKKMIRQYRSCRNTLAHGDICSVSQTVMILSNVTAVN